MPSVDPVAAYAATLATLVAIWNVYATWRARSSTLRVSADIGSILLPTDPVLANYKSTGTFVVFKAENVGALTVRVQSCGMARTKRRWGRRVPIERLQLTIPEISPPFPQDIAPGHAYDAPAGLAKFWEGMAPGRTAGYEHAYFKDAVGRTYLGKVTPRLLDALESYAEEQNNDGDRPPVSLERPSSADA